MDARQKYIELALRKESTAEELKKAAIDMLCEDVASIIRVQPEAWLPEIKKP